MMFKVSNSAKENTQDSQKGLYMVIKVWNLGVLCRAKFTLYKSNLYETHNPILRDGLSQQLRGNILVNVNHI